MQVRCVADVRCQPGALTAKLGRDRLERRMIIAVEILEQVLQQRGYKKLTEGSPNKEIEKKGCYQRLGGPKVYVNYVGRLPDGTVFDFSTQPQWFRLDSVIAGWRSALTQMPVGSKWRLAIPSDQAYGADGAGDLIAPYTPLVFEIELLDIK